MWFIRHKIKSYTTFSRHRDRLESLSVEVCCVVLVFVCAYMCVGVRV